MAVQVSYEIRTPPPAPLIPGDSQLKSFSVGGGGSFRGVAPNFDYNALYRDNAGNEAPSGRIEPETFVPSRNASGAYEDSFDIDFGKQPFNYLQLDYSVAKGLNVLTVNSPQVSSLFLLEAATYEASQDTSPSATLDLKTDGDSGGQSFYLPVAGTVSRADSSQVYLVTAPPGNPPNGYANPTTGMFVEMVK